MHEEKKFKELVFYLEACESGSMFQNLPSDWNVFATTAANATTSSYACYWNNKRQTFLGDVYSVKWLEDSDNEDLVQETLEKQYEIVKEETFSSSVMQFGDMSISRMHVSQFQGGRKSDEKAVKKGIPKLEGKEDMCKKKEDAVEVGEGE